ncbi:unnamed protein product [Dracunculus medinensis]|uniref:Ig-like domain-containing protein n=1 Tax=Dracunculus medinensis TaxID=318479 RepID=A0A0N4U9D4_DRAME|nr:unnamed protein product [Dracunculus medinensis]
MSSDEQVFLTTPKSEPYFVLEGQTDLILECSFSPKYSNRSRYEVAWTMVTQDLPKHLTRNDASFVKSKYELLQNDRKYNLQIKRVQYQYDNGKFYCTLLDKENGAQKIAQATVVVMG